jgi:hypothetical protein
MRACLLAALLVAGLAVGPGAAACNPDPPRPAAVQAYGYGPEAARYLLDEANSVVAARLAFRLDLELGEQEGGQADYVFEVLEGWREVTPRRLVISGHWVDCAIEPRTGRVFLLYLDGDRLLHAVPVAQLDFEFALLGEARWFYDAGGQLVVDPERGSE